jgi:hypothetical protein
MLLPITPWPMKVRRQADLSPSMYPAALKWLASTRLRITPLPGLGSADPAVRLVICVRSFRSDGRSADSRIARESWTFRCMVQMRGDHVILQPDRSEVHCLLHARLGLACDRNLDYFLRC